MRHLKISRILGGRLSINSKLRGLRHLAGGALVQPMQHLKYIVKIKKLKSLRRFQNL